MLGAEPTLAETTEYAMLPRQLRAEARRLLRPVPTPVEPTPPPSVASPILTTIPSPTEPTPVPATPSAPPPTTPSRSNTVRSKGGVPGARTLPVAPPPTRQTKRAAEPTRLVPEVVIEAAATRRVFYQVRQPSTCSVAPHKLRIRDRIRHAPRARNETQSAAGEDRQAPDGVERALRPRRSAPCWIRRR